MKHLLQLTLLLSGLLMAATVSSAETHTVKGVGVQFKPVIVFADKGDVIAFRDMPTHFVHVPYLYKCPPHWGARMGGLIIVGDKLQNKEKLIDVLSDYRETIDDKIAQGYLKKSIKNIKKGKIKIPG